MSTITNNNPGSAAFTPGPWTIEREGVAPGWDKDDSEAVTVHGHRHAICVVNTNDPTFRGEANARLIAAAPDLYEACKLFVAEHNEVADTEASPMFDGAFTWPEGGWTCGCQACVKALAALAKAGAK